MKSIWVAFSILVLTVTTQAASISASTGQKTFKTFSSPLSQDVDTAERLLRVYMEDSMRCSRIRMNLNILKEDGIFSDGIFVVNLTADCDTGVRDLQLDFDPLCSRKNYGEAALLLRYVKSGSVISKRFIVQNSQSCQE